MVVFVNVIKKNPQVQMRKKDIIDKYKKLPYNYQSKIGYDTLIQNVLLKKIKNLLGTTIVNIDIELKMKISRITYLESRLLKFFVYVNGEY